MNEILKEWETETGYKAVVLKTKMGHNCGYVGIDNSHPLYGKGYSDHCNCLKFLWELTKYRPAGRVSPITIVCFNIATMSMRIVIDVHQGVTYSDCDENYPIESNLHWIGFDCAHDGDSPEKQDLEYCISECEHLSAQLNLVNNYGKQKHALELAREALSYEIGFIEDHCNEDDKQLLLDKQALEAITEALK